MAALREKAEERSLGSIESFMLATHAWLDWLIYIEELGWSDVDGKMDELSRRVRQRNEAHRRLLLLASPPLYRWLVEIYGPVEYEVKRTYARQLRMVGTVDDEGMSARRAYGKLLRVDLVEIVRPEIQGLRDPRRLGARFP
ncbi:hypothetical protein Lfu02_40410 [Longispora fulva]|nr:hypothetical protein Lfu02_40410 [Longispora fulva]